MTTKIDITERATALGWALPAGFRVLAWLEHDEDGDPRTDGDVYLTDVDEKDYDHPTHAFCKHCGHWVHEYAGMWLGPANSAGSEEVCQGSVNGEHAPDESVAIRWWHEDLWEFVGVLVTVEDISGQEWGNVGLWTVESGHFPVSVDKATGEITAKDIDPLTEDYPLSELIPEALEQAQARLRSIHEAAPAIMGPDQREPQTDAEWLAELFATEVCGECGWDADRHHVTPDPLGNRHATCDDPLSEDYTEGEADLELIRRIAISAADVTHETHTVALAALTTGHTMPDQPRPSSVQAAGEHYRLAESLADESLNGLDLSDTSRARLATLALVHATLAMATPAN
jgi:hypothetical protein